ncbi:aminotransferase class I/II-fold pyridoxal phosphate-dependent enzyme [Klebsiella pneumoniae]|uniref:aminotransferase class I/II-fold pyridoxal phosphate-dependent enzyme n=1 Tax=Klebsiella pneumoniae TaxID=573 RepID=UPI002D7A3B13|nr:aminotransferase class I/II-fold pyridoxal phosphate-dependent enzyme [Klebsiella pneumoniae]WRP45867.1 aminotransferase class I/II-fold pyridoxal phosphate-dependent enzyme [Klebsiella pneumoniae]
MQSASRGVLGVKKSAGGWEPDWEDFARKASQADLRVKILFLCNPHNPTGRVWRPDELKRIIEICLANDIWVISDEIHCDLSRSGIGHTPAASLSLILHALLPACPRVKHQSGGNLLANIIIPDPGVRSEWRLRHDEFISPLSLAANKAAWSECDDWLVHLREYIDGNFQYLHDYLKSYLPETSLDPRRDISGLDRY